MFLWATAVLAWFWVAYLGLFQEYLFLCVCSRKIPYFSGQLQAIQKGMVTSDPLCLKPSGFEGMVEKFLGNLVFCKEAPLFWEPASSTPVLMGVLEPFLGDIKLIIHQTVSRVPGIGKEYSNLAVLPFTQSATVLPLYPNGMSPFLYKAGIINRKH